MVTFLAVKGDPSKDQAMKGVGIMRVGLLVVIGS